MIEAKIIKAILPAVIAAGTRLGTAAQQGVWAQDAKNSQYCANIADAASDARFALQKQALADMEKEIEGRLKVLEAKRAEYEEWLRSSVADLKNHGGISEAGAIQGAAFLKQFVEETPWVHLDIAGTAYFNKTKGIHSEGGTGVGVRTLIQLAIRFAGR